LTRRYRVPVLTVCHYIPAFEDLGNRSYIEASPSLKQMHLEVKSEAQRFDAPPLVGRPVSSCAAPNRYEFMHEQI
jgi:hypothetical protein